MTPRQYAVGVAVTTVVSIAFYGTLLHVAGVSRSTLALVMAVTVIAMSLAAVVGYRRWRSVRQPETATTAASRRPASALLIASVLAAGCAAGAAVLWVHDARIWAAGVRGPSDPQLCAGAEVF